MLNNSIIVNTQGEDGTPYNDLLVFSEDKKSFKEYGLHKYQDYFIGYSDEYYFVDSKEKP